MKRTKMGLRVGALALVLLLLLGLVACSGKKPGGQTGTTGGTNGTEGSRTEEPTEAPVETDEWGQEILKDNVPSDLRFEGEEIKIVTRPRELWIREFGLEKQSDTVDEEIYFRNYRIESRLGISVKMSTSNDLTATAGEKLKTFVRAQYEAGQYGVDIVVGAADGMAGAEVWNWFVNLNDSAKMPYLDTTRRYWNQNYIRAAEVYGNLYYIIGDLNLSVWDRTMVTFANLNTLNSIGVDNIFDTVINKGWTLEYMEQILRNYVPASEDKYGLHSVSASEAWDAFYGAFRLNMLEQRDNDYVLNVSGNEKLAKASERVHNLYYQGSNLYSNVLLTKTYDDTFVNGNALFEIDVLSSGASQTAKLRNMVDKYAILPIPMYDSEQGEYGAMAQDAYNLMAVMNSASTNTGLVSAYLELMSAESYAKVRPVYVKGMLTGRNLADSRNVKVMNMIFDSVYFDTAVIYSKQLESISQTLWRATTRDGVAVSTAYASIESKLNAALAVFKNAYMTN